MQNKNLNLKDILKHNRSYQSYKNKFKQELENAEKFDVVKDKEWYLSYYEMLKKYIIQFDKSLPKIEECKDKNGNILSLSFLKKDEETFFRSLFKVNNISACYDDYWRSELSIDSYYEAFPLPKRSDMIKKDIDYYFRGFKEMRIKLRKKIKSEIKDQNKISGLEIYNIISKTSVFKNYVREYVENKLADERPKDFIEYESDYYKHYKLEDLIFADDFFSITADEIGEIMDKNLCDRSVQCWIGSGSGTYENNLEDLSNKIEKCCMCGIKTNPDMIIKFYYEILPLSIAKATREQWFKPKFGIAYNYLKANSAHENHAVLNNISEYPYKILIDNEVPKCIKNILDTFDNLYGYKVDKNIIQKIKRDCEYMIEFMQEQNIIEQNDNLKIKDEDITVNLWDKICEFICVVIHAFPKLFSSDYKIADMAKLRKLKTWLKNSTATEAFQYNSEFNASSDLTIGQSSESKNKISVSNVLNNIKQISEKIPVLENNLENQKEIN